MSFARIFLVALGTTLLAAGCNGELEETLNEDWDYERRELPAQVSQEDFGPMLAAESCANYAECDCGGAKYATMQDCIDDRSETPWVDYYAGEVVPSTNERWDEDCAAAWVRAERETGCASIAHGALCRLFSGTGDRGDPCSGDRDCGHETICLLDDSDDDSEDENDDDNGAMTCQRLHEDLSGGKRCSYSWRCGADLRCEGARDVGVCIPAFRAGEECKQVGDCETGTRCWGVSTDDTERGVCLARVAEGGSCNGYPLDTNACPPGAPCDFPMCDVNFEAHVSLVCEDNRCVERDPVACQQVGGMHGARAA